MKPFNHQLDENDLIAYHLRELSPRQQRSVRRILQQNAALTAESEAIAATLRAFPKQEAALPIDAALRERTWLALLPSLVVHFPARHSRFSRLRTWSLPVLAGTAFAATAFLILLHHNRHTQPPTVATVATTHSLTFPTLSPSAGSNAALSSGARPNAFNPRARTIIRALFPSSAPPSSAPIEAKTEAAKNSLPSFPGEPPAPLTPIEPSSAASGITSTGSTASLLSSTAQPQSSSQPNKPRQSPGLHRPHLAEFTLAIFGDITASQSSTYNSGTSLTSETDLQTASPAIGALASFRQQFRPRLGYRLTTTYTSPSFETGTNTHFRIYEFSGTYVVRGPRRRRFTTSIEAGASLLDFLSTDDYYPSPPFNSRVLRGAGVVGVGTEYALNKHWGLRAEYRALVYKPPAFSSTSGSSAPPSSLTFSSNPVLGITYRFGAKGND